jgi:hypothetical protein
VVLFGTDILKPYTPTNNLQLSQTHTPTVTDDIQLSETPKITNVWIPASYYPSEINGTLDLNDLFREDPPCTTSPEWDEEARDMADFVDGTNGDFIPWPFPSQPYPQLHPLRLVS